MNTATAPIDPATNVEQFPTPPRLRVVEKLAEAEADVVAISERVEVAIEKARKPRAKKITADEAPRRARKPRAPKVDPILQASRANDTQANADASGVSALADSEPASDAQAPDVGSEILLGTVAGTALPEPPNWFSRIRPSLVFGLLAAIAVMVGTYFAVA